MKDSNARQAILERPATEPADRAPAEPRSPEPRVRLIGGLSALAAIVVLVVVSILVVRTGQEGEPTATPAADELITDVEIDFEPSERGYWNAYTLEWVPFSEGYFNPYTLEWTLIPEGFWHAGSGRMMLPSEGYWNAYTLEFVPFQE